MRFSVIYDIYIMICYPSCLHVNNMLIRTAAMMSNKDAYLFIVVFPALIPQANTRDLNLIEKGASKGQSPGVEDYRVECEPGRSNLIGYVLVCVGTARILAWKAGDQEAAHMFKVIAPHEHKSIR